MHSFQPSRGRIMFEVLCAIGIAASCGGAWMQTGASALLAGASVATLYGLVHFFDLFRSGPSVEVEPQRIEFDPPAELEPVPAWQDLGGATLAEPKPPVSNVVEDLQRVPKASPSVVEAADEEPAAPAKSNRKTKAPRKSVGRRSSTPKELTVAETAPAADADLEVPALHEEVKDDGGPTVEDVPHTQVVPLFEPDPFHRMPRQAFGRRGRI